MTTARARGNRRATTLMFGLMLAAACTDGSSNDGGGDAGTGGTAGMRGVGGTPTLVGPAFEQLNDLAGEVLADSSVPIEGVRFAASRVAQSLANAGVPPGSAAALEGGGDPSCPLGPIDGRRFIYSRVLHEYEPAGEPTEPNGAVSFAIYEIVGDAPNADVIVGNLRLTCTQGSEQVDLTATLEVDGLDVIRVEGKASPDPRAKLGSVDVSSIRGFLASASGAHAIDFGASGEEWMSQGEDSRSGSLVFTVGPSVTATLQYDAQRGAESHYDLSLVGTLDSAEFRFEAPLAGIDGRLSGPGILDQEHQVCCFDGHLEDMTVSAGTPSCDPLDDYTAAPLSDDELSAIQAGYDALTSMYIAVESAAVAMGALAEASARHVFHTPPDCDNLLEPEGDDCLSVPIDLFINPTYDPTFSAIYDELFCSRGCANGECHNEGAGDLLFRSKQEAYCALVNVAPSALCENDFDALVIPGNPDGSLLVPKLGFDPPCGAPMPIGSRESNDLVTDAHRAQVVKWIADGAAYNPILETSGEQP